MDLGVPSGMDGGGGKLEGKKKSESFLAVGSRRGALTLWRVDQKRNMSLFALRGSLGCLQRVDLRLSGCDRSLHMRCEVTVPRFPLDARIGIAHAKATCGKLHDPRATFALLHHLVALTPIVPTSGLRHEGAVGTRLQRLANHDDHLPFLSRFSSENRGNTTHEKAHVKRFKTLFDEKNLVKRLKFSGILAILLKGVATPRAVMIPFALKTDVLWRP